MAIAANWADEIRDVRPETSPWHFVDLEIDGDLRYRPARDCPGGNCVIAQITRDEAVLTSGASAAARAEALRFLIHFVGDIHQPLHAADNHDRGGNMMQVSVRRGRPESLHHVWDDDVVEVQGRDPAILARDLDRGFGPAQKMGLMAGSSAAAWAEDSAAVAKAAVYPQAARGRTIDGRALADDARIARQQLAKAGYALAGLLNRIFQ